MRPNGVWRVSGYLLLIEADQAIFPSSTFPDFTVSYIHINIVRPKIRKYSKTKKNQATPENIISENSLPVTQVRQWNICDRVFTVETVKTSEIRKNLSHSYHLFLRAKLCSCNWVVCCVLLCRPHSPWPSVILFPRFIYAPTLPFLATEKKHLIGWCGRWRHLDPANGSPCHVRS